MRNPLLIAAVGLALFLVGAIGGPALGEEAPFPVWIFTWLGLILLVVGAVMWVMQRRGGSRSLK